MIRVAVLALAGCASAPRPASMRGGRAVRHPVADLAPIWRIDERTDAVLGGGDGLMVIAHRDGPSSAVHLIDTRDGYLTPALASPVLGFASHPAALGSRVAFVSLITKAVTVIERPREDDEQVRVRWLQPLGDDSLIDAVAIDRDRVYAAFIAEYKVAPQRRALAAFAAADGAPAWRRELPERMSTEHLDGGGPIVVAAGRISTPSETIVLGLDAATGETRWTYRGASSLGMVIDRDVVMLARGGELELLDRATGAARRLRVPELGGVARPDLAIADGVAYVTSWLPDATGSTAFAIELSGGHVRWRRREPTTSSALLTPRAFVVLTTGGMLHGLDRATGALEWQWGIGDARHNRLVAADDRLLVVDERGITAFAPVDSPPVVEDVVIEGRITVACGNAGGEVIEIGDAEVAVRRDGHFELRLLARGVVAVRPPAWFEDPIDVELTGRGRYRLGTIEVSKCTN